MRSLSCSAGHDLKDGGRSSCTWFAADRVYIPECKHVMSQVIRMSHLSPKAILTQLMYRNSECVVAHRGCVGGVCNAVLRNIFIVT